jgi:hypothetical protein
MLWGPKVMGVLTLGILRFPFRSPGTKCHLDVGLVKRHRVYYNGYNFALNFILIGGLHTKLWALKSQEFQFWEFRYSRLGVPRQNVIWMWASWRGTQYIIQGKVVASPKSGPWFVL